METDISSDFSTGYTDLVVLALVANISNDTHESGCYLVHIMSCFWEQY